MSYERLTTVDKDGHIDITGIWDVDMRREDERKYHAAKTVLPNWKAKSKKGTLLNPLSK
jgi:hypothetical protein